MIAWFWEFCLQDLLQQHLCVLFKLSRPRFHKLLGLSSGGSIIGTKHLFCKHLFVIWQCPYYANQNLIWNQTPIQKLYQIPTETTSHPFKPIVRHSSMATDINFPSSIGLLSNAGATRYVTPDQSFFHFSASKTKKNWKEKKRK